MAQFDRPSPSRLNTYRLRQRDAKGTCSICGRSRHNYHDDKKCAEAYIKQLDASGTNPSNRR